MKRSIAVWQFLGFAFTSLLGTILHFLYDFTGKNRFAALFSGVNESTWEHMKLLYFPMLIFAVIQSFFFKDEYPDFWCIKLRGTLLGLWLIPILFYTYNGIFGASPDFINIAIFFVAAASAYLYETKQFQKEDTNCSCSSAACICLCFVGILFVFLTFYPIQIPLFQDPITKNYGI